MTISPKLFIDTCLARPLGLKAHQYYKTVYPSLNITHLTDVYRQSRCDSVWVKRCSEEGGWIAVSADRGKKKPPKTRKIKPKLPQLCAEYGVTCVNLTAKLAQKGTLIHLEVFNEILRNIEAIYRAPNGTVVTIFQHHDHQSIIKFGFKVQGIALSTFLKNNAL